MNMLKRGLITVLVLMLGVGVWAQASSTVEKKKTWKDASNLSAQYKGFKSGLRRYREFIYLDDEILDGYYNVVSDSVLNLKSDLSSTKNKVTALNKEVADLKTTQVGIQDKLDTALEEGSTLSVFGSRADKGSFASVMWVVVFVLLGICAFVFFLFKRSHVVTKQSQKDFSNLHDEFEDNRKNTLERERKLRRELQDYINKVEEMKIKGRG